MFDDITFASRHGDDADPLLAMFEERLRLYDLAAEKGTAGDKILSALPEEIQRKWARVEIPQAWRKAGWYAGEALLNSNIEILRHRLGADPAWFEENIAQPALAQLRAGLAKIAETREASGCEALYREADEFARQAEELEHRICSTTATSLEGLLSQLELARELMEIECVDVSDDCEERLNASIGHRGEAPSELGAGFGGAGLHD